jgi:hypothetical protein
MTRTNSGKRAKAATSSGKAAKAVRTARPARQRRRSHGCNDAGRYPVLSPVRVEVPKHAAIMARMREEGLPWSAFARRVFDFYLKYASKAALAPVPVTVRADNAPAANQN